MQYPEARKQMVEYLRRFHYLRTPDIISAFLSVPRHLFVPDDVVEHAYKDCPQPIGYNQTISAPHMVAMMTEILCASDGMRILEVGAGSGYQTAILSTICPNSEITSIEFNPQLSDSSSALLGRLGHSNVEVVCGDGSIGYAKKAPYEWIIVTAASPSVPEQMTDQLSSGGKLLIPVGSRWHQQLLELTKKDKDHVVSKDHGGCVFVPLVGKEGW